MLDWAPPPPGAELLITTQLFSVPLYTPPPPLPAELALTMQFDRAELGSSHQTAPPRCSRATSPAIRVAPPVSVNPDKLALVASQAQRIAPSPLVVPGNCRPWMTVTSGPLTLCILSRLS